MCTADMNAALALDMFGQAMQGRARTQLVRTTSAGLADAAVLDIAAIQARQGQELRAARDQVGARAAEAQQELGRINAVLSDANLSGVTADIIRADAVQARDRDIVAIQDNAAARLAQSRRELQATKTDYTNRIRGQQTTSPIADVLGLAGDALNQKGPTVGDLGGRAGRYVRDNFNRRPYPEPSLYIG